MVYRRVSVVGIAAGRGGEEEDGERRRVCARPRGPRRRHGVPRLAHAPPRRRWPRPRRTSPPGPGPFSSHPCVLNACAWHVPAPRRMPPAACRPPHAARRMPPANTLSVMLNMLKKQSQRYGTRQTSMPCSSSARPSYLIHSVCLTGAPLKAHGCLVAVMGVKAAHGPGPGGRHQQQLARLIRCSWPGCIKAGGGCWPGRGCAWLVDAIASWAILHPLTHGLTRGCLCVGPWRRCTTCGTPLREGACIRRCTTCGTARAPGLTHGLTHGVGARVLGHL